MMHIIHAEMKQGRMGNETPIGKIYIAHWIGFGRGLNRFKQKTIDGL
jgi:hypothetical protein